MPTTPPPTDTTDELREAARLHLERRRTLVVHATVFTLSMVIVVVVNAAINVAAGISGNWWAWWSVLALIGWGIGIAIHGLAVWWSHPRRRLANDQERIAKILASIR